MAIGSHAPPAPLGEEFAIDLPAEVAARGAATAIVTTTWNRPRYLRRMWRSLAASELGDAVVIVVDDASDDPRTKALLASLALPRAPVIRMVRRVRGMPQPHGGLRAGWDLACWLGARTLVNLDADMLVKPDWLRRMTALQQKASVSHGEHVVTGFNALLHRVAANGPDFREKRTIGGASLLVSRATYEAWLRACLSERAWDWNMVAAARERAIPFLVTRPSVVQHIGRAGLFSNWRRGSDFAPDYRFDLPVVFHAVAFPRRAVNFVWRRLKA